MDTYHNTATIDMGYSVEYAKKQLDDKLREMNISEEQVASQDLQELNSSLSKIELVINDPRKLGDINYQYAVIPLLYERKRMILLRIKDVETNKKIENIQQIVGQLSEKEKKDKISSLLDLLSQGGMKYDKEIHDSADRETEAKIKLDQQRIDGFERKSKIWLSFLQRESAASIIGGIVLLMLTVALIFGKESQILSNGFLVILGYFFGQSSSKNKDSNFISFTFAEHHAQHVPAQQQA